MACAVRRGRPAGQGVDRAFTVVYIDLSFNGRGRASVDAPHPPRALSGVDSAWAHLACWVFSLLWWGGTFPVEVVTVMHLLAAGAGLGRLGRELAGVKW